MDKEPEGYERLFTVSVDQKTRSVRMVGRDSQGRYFLENYEEYSRGSATGSVSRYTALTYTEFRRYAKEALQNGCVTQAEYEKLTGKGHITGLVVYRDARYTLGQNEDRPCLVADGRRFWLSCSPYEPCLYITDEDGDQTVVHNAFDPRDVLRDLRDGGTVTSITGREYNALDFCRMAEYAAGRGNIGMDDAERVFGDEPKVKKAPERRKETAPKAEPPREERQSRAPLPREAGEPADPFYALLAEYPGCVIDYCIVEGSLPRYRGCEAHRQMLARACRRLLAEEGWRYDLNRARGKLMDPKALFAAVSPKGGLSYRRAFLSPPQGSGCTEADFDRVNAALFPRGTDKLEVYEWTTDWSDYFDEGREWWGTLCLSVYDRAMERYAVILASATD